MTADPYDLARFVAAQDPVLPQVRAELAAGRKTTHWMWFVFPQLRALGRSATALHYGITGRDEAAAYLAHPLLGPRLIDCTALVDGGTLEGIFGKVDALKFRSCMTLFDAVQPGAIFAAALARWCGGARDQRTLDLLGAP
jgi:uncharacterized protein (DUF1810 family)